MRTWVILGIFMLTMVAIFCTRNPIGDRILAKACIIGQSKFGACQMAK